MTTVACLYVRGEYPYTVQYVARLREMVDRWMDRPFRFVCLTDRPDTLPPGVEPIRVDKLHGFAPWTKLQLFNPARGWSGRVLYLDLDVLIVAPLAQLLDVPAQFAITDDPTGKQGRDSFKRQIVRRFNSSVMVWDGGTQTDLYTSWSPAVSDRLSGDQDHIGEQQPEVYRLPRAWFPRLSEVKDGPTPDAKVILAKVPKNHIAADLYPWFGSMWGAA